MEEKRIKRAIWLYPLYEAASGDLLFYSVIETLFLTLVKGFTVQEIAAIVFITDLADLLLEYPTYRIIRRIGNSRAVTAGGILPLISIVMITAGKTLPVVVLGNIVVTASGNFQSMASAAARNNLVLTGEKDRYAGLFSRSNIIYAAASMTAATLIPFAFTYNRYLPSLICTLVYTLVAVSAFLIPDFTESKGGHTQEKKDRNSSGKIGKGLFLLLAVFCGFFCAGSVFGSNTQLFLSGRLAEMLSEKETIFFYGGIIWLSRAVKLGSNVALSRVLALLKEKIVVISTVCLFAAFLMIGVTGLVFPKGWLPIVTAGIFYVVVRGIFWDPLRTFLRMTAADTNSKKQQQTTLIALNAGQSVTKLLMDLIVVGILKVFSLEYVFLAFAAVLAAIVLLSFVLKRELGGDLELLRYEAVLTTEEIDRISGILFERLLDAGMEQKEALSHRLLSEEKLLECISSGKAGQPFVMVLSKKLDGFFVDLKVGEEKLDIFEIPLAGDEISRDIFFNIVGNI